MALPLASGAVWIRAVLGSIREIGVDESRIDYACDVVLYCEFASLQALVDYAAHPDHLRVKRTLGDMRTTRHQVDDEVAGAQPPRQRRDP